MYRQSKSTGFKPYIRTNVQRNWEIILLQHKAMTKFVDTVYLQAKKAGQGYSSQYHQFRVMGTQIRAILHNESFLLAFFRAYFKDEIENVCKELNALKYNQQ